MRHQDEQDVRLEELDDRQTLRPEDTALRQSGLRHRSGQALARLGLAIVLPAWVVVSLIERVHRQRRRPRLPDLRRLRQVFALLRSAIAVLDFDWDENLSGELIGARPNRRR